MNLPRFCHHYTASPTFCQWPHYAISGLLVYRGSLPYLISTSYLVPRLEQRIASPVASLCRSFHMAPGLAVHNEADSREVYSHDLAYRGQSVPLCEQSPYFAHLGLSELGATIPFASSPSFGGAVPLPAQQAFRMGVTAIPLSTRRPSLSIAIMDIIQVRTGPQMGEVAARRIVTVVKHIRADGDRPLGQLVSEAVRLDLFGVGESECAIAITVSPRRPRPTPIRPC